MRYLVSESALEIVKNWPNGDRELIIEVCVS